MTPSRAPAFALVLGLTVLLPCPGLVRADDTIPPVPPPVAPAAPPEAAALPATPPEAPAAPPALPAGKAPAPAAKPAPSGAAPTEWRVGDVLEVRVLARPDLTCSVRVVADGTIDVPFSGRYRLLGRALEEVRAEIEAGFSKLERTPQVALTVSSLAPDEFYVLGEVAKPGVYVVPRTKKLTFLMALGMAGGFGPEADFTRVQIVPGSGGDPRTVDASPGRLASLAGLLVADRDTLVVPPVGRIYLMGQVNRTGGFAPPAGEKMTLSRVIALAGGFTRLADTTSVLVTWRAQSGEQMSQRYNVKAILNGGMEDIQIFPGNLVFVPERLL